jgi:hypothetical protein
LKNILGDYNSIINYQACCRTIANKVNTLMENQKPHNKESSNQRNGISIKGLNAMAQSLKNK